MFSFVWPVITQNENLTKKLGVPKSIGVEGTVTSYSYSVTVTGYRVIVTGYSVTVTGYSSLPLKNCLTMAISVAPSYLVIIIINKLLMTK
jgi:hypothetical protein